MKQISTLPHASATRTRRTRMVRTAVTAALVCGLSFGAMAPAAADTGASVRAGPSSVICGYLPLLCKGGH